MNSLFALSSADPSQISLSAIENLWQQMSDSMAPLMGAYVQKLIGAIIILLVGFLVAKNRRLDYQTSLFGAECRQKDRQFDDARRRSARGVVKRRWQDGVLARDVVRRDCLPEGVRAG